MRFKWFPIILVLTMMVNQTTVFAEPVNQQVNTVNGKVRKERIGRFAFPAGDAIYADSVELDDGRKDSECYLPVAPINGVMDGKGVRNPYQAEIEGKKVCSFATESGGGPPKPEDCLTVNCKPRIERLTGRYAFPAGDAILADVVELDDGRKDTKCFLDNALINGVFEKGVRNPWKTEAAPARRCDFSNAGSPPVPAPGSPKATPVPGSCQTVNCKTRIPRDGRYSFPAGDAVVAAVVELDDGRRDLDCYLPMAPMNGVLEKGVRNPWPSELKRECTFSGDNSPTPVPSASPTPTAQPSATPVPGPTPNPACDTVDCKANQNTARDGNPLSFEQNDAIWAGRIVFDDGQEVGPCYLFAAPKSGKMFDGSKHPYNAELLKAGIDPNKTRATCTV